MVWAAVFAGTVLAGVIWHNNHWKNFVYLWSVPQVVTLAVMLFIGARPAALAGAALAHASYLGLFDWYARTYYATDGLIWLRYFFSLPGGFVGSMIVTRLLCHRGEWSSTATALAAAAVVSAGFAINHGCVWLLALL